MNQSASGLTMILGGGIDARANQSMATSIHRAEISQPAMERRNTETTIQRDGASGAAGGFSDPINFGLRNGNNNGIISQGLRGPLDQTMNTEAVAAVAESGKCCRICLEDEEDLESGNPFITPCKCTGSMKYIHLKCLREWTDSKKQFQEDDGISSYYWENLNCELCKAGLDLVVRSSTDPDKAIFLLDLNRPTDSPYMILESDIECPSKAVHIINFGKKTTFTVGRRVNNDISISDISVSRRQACFVLEKETVSLMDLDSKFGTFQKILRPEPVKQDGSFLPVQIEKKCFFLKVEPRFSKCERFCNTVSRKNGSKLDLESYDYFLHQIDKYPLTCRELLAPFLIEIKKSLIE